MAFEMEDDSKFQFTDLDREHIESMDEGDVYHSENECFTALKYPSEYVLIVENKYKDGFKTPRDVIFYLRSYKP